MLCGTFASSVQVNAAACGEPTMLASALRGRPMSFIGIEIGEDKMRTLWSIATTPPAESTPFFGKVIAEDQDWLSSCQYPGIGIGAGSGLSWRDRNVTLWVWADAVDLSAARLSIHRLIGVVTTTTTTTSTTSTTTSTTTTTTVLPTTTTSTSTTSSTTTIMPEPETTTTMTAAPEEAVATMSTFTTIPMQYAVAQAVSVMTPIAAQTLRVEAQKASTAKKAASTKSKTKIVKKKPTKKKAVKKKWPQ